jgi:hypothetical protein
MIIGQNANIGDGREPTALTKIAGNMRSGHSPIQLRTAYGAAGVDDAASDRLQIFLHFWNQQRSDEFDRSRDWRLGIGASGIRLYKPVPIQNVMETSSLARQILSSTISLYE